ncbi:hypothetical protein EJV46_03300 [Roseococcus sp. SYP-B2431]|uniref:hypothetical protein n=1 Tax=Roseococcus sp. SYP-B2431 TaxID=2496640 RepID=UPI0010394851|nr:hypothetical protein [Roseococcus sp. SYP-B2431]TCH99715.1 hypothetical protein EJV46_03300 [Roseococcus sp. SYP-B2431]
MADVLIDWNAAGNVLDSDGEIVGQIGVGGMGSAVRIPVPGTNGLAIEFSPRGWTPQSGSTSRLFIQDLAGKRMLRLDYGYNIKTKTIDFHWNQKGVAQDFRISNHTPAGRMGEGSYKGARYFKWGGRVFLAAAVVADGYSVVLSDRPWRQLAIVTGGWTGAWAGCKVFGAAGAAIGTAIEPGGGTAIGGVVGCFAGSLGGYWAGKTLVTMAVDSETAEKVTRSVEELLGPPTSGFAPSNNACRNPPPLCSSSVGVYAL